MGKIEDPIQRSIVAWLRLVLPDAIIHHSPNEGVRGGKAGMMDGARKKAMGQASGFPDIIVIAWSNIGPLFFEVKSKIGRVSDVQRDMIERLTALGYKAAVVRSIDDVRACLAIWAVATKERP